jgi:hypothetical protein
MSPGRISLPLSASLANDLRDQLLQQPQVTALSLESAGNDLLAILHDIFLRKKF